MHLKDDSLQTNNYLMTNHFFKLGNASSFALGQESERTTSTSTQKHKITTKGCHQDPTNKKLKQVTKKQRSSKNKTVKLTHLG